MKKQILFGIFALLLLPALSFADDDVLFNLGDLDIPPLNFSGGMSANFNQPDLSQDTTDDIECKIIDMEKRSYLFCQGNGVIFVEPSPRYILDAE